jgi:hypothetical protein
VKNKILMGITYLMVAVLFIAGCGLDSGSVLPYILCSVSLAWLALFTEVNREVISKW